MSSTTAIRGARYWIRRLIQAVALFTIAEFSYYGIFRCPFAVPYVSCANCPVVQCPGKQLWLIVLLGILASGLLFGRAFCGYACPAGMLNELFSKVAVLRGKVRGKFAAVAGYGKYVAAAICAVLFFGMHNPRWAVPIRTGEFVNSTVLTFEHAFPLWLIRTSIVVGTLLLGLLIPYFFCRFLCPTGGVLEILGRFSPFKYRVADSCTDCGKCDRTCGLETRPERDNCTNCGECRSVCPVDAIHLGTAAKGRGPQSTA
ncbi:putative electron transport protein YccM [Pseudodesulfovibrio hydrargyri]|uniref:Putative electron transport protein YccM n=1 Tax=Pseudodesulfovibrio hydrargyri TaxID=2125990 RepID=A0A1J5MXR0_9BACT|nr:4Fe-4S binding protein [Pseudodesulfovibrio hydrargyri]OIQ51317.1 putative electron transport protein YccM [Pseudodesulfovibrio hydrargyri]